MVCAIMKANRTANKCWCVLIENEHRAYAAVLHHHRVHIFSSYFHMIRWFWWVIFCLQFRCCWFFLSVRFTFPSNKYTVPILPERYQLYTVEIISIFFARMLFRRNGPEQICMCSHNRQHIKRCVCVPEYSEVMRERVYRVPPLWPKNRAENFVRNLHIWFRFVMDECQLMR